MTRPADFKRFLFWIVAGGLTAAGPVPAAAAQTANDLPAAAAQTRR